MAASRSDKSDESVVEQPMITAVGRLFLMESLSRNLTTLCNLAPCFEVDHSAAHDIALMAEAYSERIVDQETPPQLHNAGVGSANLAVNVHHAIVCMSRAIFCDLATVDV